MFAALSQGCASSPPVGNIVGGENVQYLVDTAPLPRARTRELPYEWKTVDGVTVGYNLRVGFIGNNNPVYWLRLVIRNQQAEASDLQPTAYAVDSNGIVVLPYDYMGLMNYLASVANTQFQPTFMPVPASGGQASTYHHSGTFTSPTGNRTSYTGTTRSQPTQSFANSFAQGFAQGFNQAEAANANRRAREQQEAQLLMVWTDSYWLRQSYFLRPSEAASAVLIFPAPRDLPLSINVEVSGRQFTFQSTDSPR